MRFGDLSNELSTIAAVRFENVVYNFGQVNQPGKGLCDRLLSQDFNLYLITTLPERKARAWCYKWGVLYTRILEAAGPLEIPELCFHHRIDRYYDTDDRVLESVGIRGSKPTRAIKWEQPLDGPTARITY